jgi:predicted nucleotide-binding protein
MLNQQLSELQAILDLSEEDGDYESAEERLARWKTRSVKLITERCGYAYGEKFSKYQLDSYSYNNNSWNVTREAEIYRSFVLPLKEEIEQHPEYLAESQQATRVSAHMEELPDVVQPRIEQAEQNGSVFPVHGHDELNLLRLEKLLKSKWNLNPTILKEEPGQGRALIEKFEQEAAKSGFAFVLLTPDDLVKKSDGTYIQSRPIVVFELGWFYGRLGRKNVCILFKQGTAIHSDLDGVSRVEFTNSIDEAYLNIEKELQASGIV